MIENSDVVFDHVSLYVLHSLMKVTKWSGVQQSKSNATIKENCQN